MLCLSLPLELPAACTSPPGVLCFSPSLASDPVLACPVATSPRFFVIMKCALKISVEFFNSVTVLFNSRISLGHFNGFPFFLNFSFLVHALYSQRHLAARICILAVF